MAPKVRFDAYIAPKVRAIFSPKGFIRLAEGFNPVLCEMRRFAVCTLLLWSRLSRARHRLDHQRTQRIERGVQQFCGVLWFATARIVLVDA